jgi:carbon storage regulator CsrA
MLISRRKEGETLFIGDEIEIRIVSIRKNKVIFGVVAPRDVRIVAGRLSPTALANTLAAVHAVDLAVDLNRPLPHELQANTEKPLLLLKTNRKASDKKARGLL